MKKILAYLILAVTPCMAQVETDVIIQNDSTLNYDINYGTRHEERPRISTVVDSLRRVIEQTAPEGSWDDERVPITSVRVPDTGAPSWTQVYADEAGGSAGVGLYCFDNAIEQSVYFTLQIPHTWLGAVNGYDSSLHFHVHWLHSSADTGKVVWGLEYTWASIAGESDPDADAAKFGPTSIIYSGEHPVAGTAVSDRHQMSNFAPITRPDQGWSSMLICRLFRYVGYIDGVVMTSDCCVLEIDCHILKRPRGTTTEYSDD